MKYSLSASGSIHLNRRLGGKLPHLTFCAEAWILDHKKKVFFLDLLVFITCLETDHCRKQYLAYGANLKRKHNANCQDAILEDYR